jgi:hypothetical protein
MLVIQSAPQTTQNAVVACPATNPIVVGGGYSGIGAGGNGQYTIESYPSAPGPSPVGAWSVALNAADTSWTAYAICSK